MDIDAFLDGGFNSLASPGDTTSSEDDQPTTSSPAGDGSDSEVETETEHKRLKSAAARHKAQLEALKEKDPEFYEYLQETDAELLGFEAPEDDEGGEDEEEEDSEGEGDEEDCEEDDDLVAGEEEEEGEEQGADRAVSEAHQEGALITSAIVDQWVAGIHKKNTPQAWRKMLRAYRLACHFGNDEEEVATHMTISSSTVYNKIMMFVLKELDSSFRTILGLNSAASVAYKEVVRSPRWRHLQPLVKSYLTSTLHLLGHVAEPSLVAFILRQVRLSVVFLTPFGKYARKYLKYCLKIFSGSDPGPRGQAILLIRQMALTLPPPQMETSLKGVYRSFASTAKFLTASSAPQIEFMTASVVEMYRLDSKVAYELAFGYIRQLVQVMRNALDQKTKEAYKQVYCWQAVHCLELWGRVLASQGAEGDLQPLVHPLVQVMLGAARLIPSPRFFPIRLRLYHALHHLVCATGVYVPLATGLLEVLQWSGFRQKPKGPPGTAPDLMLQLRLSPPVLASAACQEELVHQVVGLIGAHLCQWCAHVAFPELVHLTICQLQLFIKQTALDRLKKVVRPFIDAVQKQVQVVGQTRDHQDFAPKDAPSRGVLAPLEAQAAKAQLPLQQWLHSFTQASLARAAQRQASEVRMKEGKKRRRGDDDEDEEDHEDEQEEDGQQKRKHGPSGRLEEEEEELPTRSHKKNNQLKASEQLKSPFHDDVDDLDLVDEDIVGLYQPSDDDEEEHEDGGRGKGGGGYDRLEEEEEEEEEVGAAHRGQNTSGGAHKHRLKPRGSFAKRDSNHVPKGVARVQRKGPPGIPRAKKHQKDERKRKRKP